MAKANGLCVLEVGERDGGLPHEALESPDDSEGAQARSRAPLRATSLGEQPLL